MLMNELEVCVGCWAVLFPAPAGAEAKSLITKDTERRKTQLGLPKSEGTVCLLEPDSGLLGYRGQQPHVTTFSFPAYRNQLGNSLGVVKAELPETLCGREFKVRALRRFLVVHG